jgi:hypothetical protein
VPDLRPLFTEETAARIQAGRQLVQVTDSCGLRLDADAQGLLRDGLGHFDMEVRWLAHLDEANVLRIWRSWVPFQIYEAVVEPIADRPAAITRLRVEQDPDRFRGRLADEPQRFEQTVTLVINTLRELRAGYTPYGPAEGAGPRPSTWPT